MTRCYGTEVIDTKLPGKATKLQSRFDRTANRLTRPDTAHYVIGFAPFGGADQFETRWASPPYAEDCRILPRYNVSDHEGEQP